MSKLHAAHEYSPCRGSMHPMQACMLMSPTALQNGVCCCDRVDKQYKPLCADEEVEKAKGQFVGVILQRPPMYSAVSIKGERLYKAARRGGFSLGLGHLQACLIEETKTAMFLLSPDDIHFYLQG